MATEPVDLDAVVEEVLRSLRPLVAAQAVGVRRPAPLGTAACHRDWIEEVFTCLIGNALRFNDKPERWIEIGAVPGVEPACYYVRDNGIGIAEADQALVFQAFRRLHEREAYGGGAGIGLAFARKIVERHGGRMWVDSTPGEGSTFSFTLAPEAGRG
jgi:signal transduction histidine kinase